MDGMEVSLVQENNVQDNTLYEIARALSEQSENGALTFEDKQKLVNKLRTVISTSTKEELQTNLAVGEIFKNYATIRVKNIPNESSSVYIKDSDNTKERVYRRLKEVDGTRLIRDAFLKLGIPYSAKKAKSAFDTMVLNVTDSVEKVSNRIIKMGYRTYWDTKECRVLRSRGDFDRIIDGDGPDGTAVCMRTLFDHSPNDRIRVDVDSVIFSQEDVDEIYDYLVENKGHIDHTYSDCFEPFWTWADEDDDTFNDILKATASVFFKEKIKGSYVLIGETRNGKSSYIKMLHTMLGSNNTSKVELAAISNPRRNMALLHTMLNAPDEEADGQGDDVKKGQGLFKSMSSHDPITIDVMYSQDAQEVPTDFMSFYPMNRMPEWTGDGVQALIQRTYPIFFRKDLSGFDNNGKNFEEETYTASFFNKLLPVLCAMGKYYSNRKLEFSETLIHNRETVRLILDSFSTYLASLRKYFTSVGPISDVIEDFILWSKENGYEYNSEILGAAKQKLQRLDDGFVTYSYGKDGLSRRARAKFLIANKKMRPKQSISCMRNDMMIAALGDRTIAQYRDYCAINNKEPRSIVSLLEEDKDALAKQEDREKHRFSSVEAKNGHITDQGELIFDE